MPGQNKDTLTISMGYNQKHGAFSEYGTSVNHITSSTSDSIFDIKSITKTKETTVLADTQMNHGVDEETLAASGVKQRINKILQIKTVDELNHHDDHHGEYHIHSLFKELKYEGEYQWGAIDLNQYRI